MRGSVYYQTAQLAKMVFCEGAKKKERIDSNSDYHGSLASYQSMDSYREIWNNIGLYVKNELGIKNFEKISNKEIKAYMQDKIRLNLSKKYLQKINSAIGKLELALNKWSESYAKAPQIYDFSIRQKLLDDARDNEELYDGYHNRHYPAPDRIIEALKKEHQIAASAELEGGVRVEAILRLKHMVFLGMRVDEFTGREVWVIETKEKGGKVGSANLSKDTYKKLKRLKKAKYVFSYQDYAKDIRETCKDLGIVSEGSHGFRWNFARNRLREIQEHGYFYDEALQQVSIEMKHNRASISEHYTGTKQS